MDTNSASDINMLSNLVQLYEQVHFNSYVGLLDTKLVIKYVSKPLLQLLNSQVKEPHKIYETNLIDKMVHYDRPLEVIEKIHCSLIKVINEQCIVENINVDLKRDINNVVLYVKFTPLYNRETKNMIAIEAVASVFKSPLLLSDPCKLLKHGVFSVSKDNDSLLSRREQEVLFLQFQCKSAKEISQKLTAIYNKSVSYNTIGRINEKLYKKFNVYNLEQLLIEAKKQNYHRKIPLTLLSDTNIEIEELW